MSWAGIANNQCISLDNLKDAVATGVFTELTAIPTGSKQITKSEAITYVSIETTIEPIASKANNQLVVKTDLVPTGATTTTTTTTTATPTSTTTTTSTTTAAPTTTTTTTSTTTAAPTTTTTTTSTTTAAPTTTTTTTTTTVSFVTFTLAYSTISGAQACSDYPTLNTTQYYASAGSTLTTGTIIYTDTALTTPAPNGFYSNGVNYWNTGAGSGNLQNQVSCNPTTTTTTTTTTAAPTTTTTTTTTTTLAVFSCDTTDTSFTTSAIFDLGTTSGSVAITGSGLATGDTYDIIYPVGGSIIHTTVAVDGSGNLSDTFVWIYNLTNTTVEITLSGV
jgi:hypothetical protein